MSNTFTCPQCGKLLKMSHEVPPGMKIKCPKCAAIFISGDQKPSVTEAPIREYAAPPPPRSAPPRESRREPEPDYYDDEPIRKSRPKKKSGSNSGLVIGLVLGGVGLLVVVVIAVIVLVVVLNNRSPQQQIIGKWQPVNNQNDFLGVTSFEFTSDGRILINFNLQMKMPGQNFNGGQNVITGRYRFINNETIELEIDNLGIGAAANPNIARENVRVNVNNDNLTLTNERNGQAASFRRIR